MAHAGVLTHVVELHRDEACFGWTNRDAAASSPAYDLFELSELDDRLESNLEGLRLAGDVGVELVGESLEEGEPGASFVAALLAIEKVDWKRLAAVLDIAAEAPETARGIAAALGFSPPESLDTVFRGLLGPEAPPALERLGVAGTAIVRSADAEPCIGRAIASADAVTRARAYRAIGELKLESLRREIDRGLADEDETVRYWAAWAGTLHHDDRGRAALEDLARESERFGARACDLLVRSLDPPRARAFLKSLVTASPKPPRAAIVGAGSLGDPSFAGWLVSLLDDEEQRRPAAWSLASIFNADVASGLRGRRPKGFITGPSDDPDDEDVAADPDEDLPWPDPEKLAAWIRERASAFEPGSRYLWGRPIEPNWLKHILVHGNQAARAGAALELSLLRRAEPLYEVRAPAHRQLAELRP